MTHRLVRPTMTFAAALLALAIGTAPAHALRVVTWNLLDYREGLLEARQPNFLPDSLQ